MHDHVRNVEIRKECKRNEFRLRKGRSDALGIKANEQRRECKEDI